MKKINVEFYNKLLPDIKSVVDPAVEKNGAETVEISFSQSYGKLNLNVFVFKTGGVDLDSLEIIHNSVSDALDAIDDKFDTDYILNVSSPGLDRPIVTEDDFRRALGTEVELVFAEPVDGRAKSHGTLVSYDAENVELEITQKQIKSKIKFERKNITTAQPFVKF